MKPPRADLAALRDGIVSLASMITKQYPVDADNLTRHANLFYRRHDRTMLERIERTAITLFDTVYPPSERKERTS